MNYKNDTPNSELPTPTRKLAIVLVSGGLDSCVCASIANLEHDMAFLHLNYGQKTQMKELDSFYSITTHFNVKQTLVCDVDYLARIGGSSLTDDKIAIPRGSPRPFNHTFPRKSWVSQKERGSMVNGQWSMVNGQGSMVNGQSAISNQQSAISDRHSQLPTPNSTLRTPNSELPTTYVPFRNTHLLSIAVSWGEIIGARSIFIGATQVDGPGYPDCREEYFRVFNSLIELGTRPETDIRVETPLIRFKKSEIIKKGVELGAPLELTWSCYRNNILACGECESCISRAKGFEEAGVVDPTID